MKYINIVLTFNMCFLVFAQEQNSYYVRHYDIFNGLSNNWISDVFQDHEGFIWCATQNGLNRFDGNDFTPYTYRPGDSTSLNANWVRSIIQLDNEHFFLGTHGKGINQMDPYLETFSNPLSQLKNKEKIVVVNKLVKDTEKNLWISSSSGTFFYNHERKVLKKLYEYRTLDISVHNDTSLLAATPKGIFTIEKDSTYQFPLLKNKKVTSIFRIKKDSVLATTDTALYLLKKIKNKWYRENLPFKTTIVSNNNSRSFIFKDKADQIWVNGGKWIWKYSTDLQSYERFEISSLLNLNSSDRLTAHCMFQDHEDNYWIGTNLGLFQLIQHKAFRHPILKSFEECLGGVREIVECNDQVWFAIPEGLYVWEKEKIKKPRLLYEKKINSMHCASNGFLYAVVNKSLEKIHLLKINTTTKAIENIFIPLPSSVCWKIVEDKNKRLWIAEWNSIVTYDLKGQNYFEVSLTKNHEDLKLRIIDLFIDNEDNLWIGTMSEGLIKISNISNHDENKNPVYQQFLYDKNDPYSISSNLIQSIHQSKNGKLWIGTDGGLNCFDPLSNKFQRFLRSDEMPDDKILNITSSKNGTLWLSTISHGVTSFEPDKEKYHTYTSRDGLYDNSMLLSSIFQNENGYIWMGSTSGLLYFHPDEVTLQSIIQPNLVWLSYTKHQSNTLQVFRFPSKEITKQNPIKITPIDQSITYQFSTLTYKEPKKTRYRFRLEGYHKNWLPVQKSGMFTISNIPKGSYKLMVEAFSIDDSWHVDHPPIHIQVIPTWYQTNLAYALYVLSIVMLLFTGYFLQLRRKTALSEKEYMQELSQKKTRWFNQIAHEFRTPLTVILGAIDQIRHKLNSSSIYQNDKHLTQIQNQTKHLSKQVGQILEIAQMKDSQLVLHYTTGDFISFQKYLLRSFSSLAESNKIQLKFSSPKEMLYISYDEDKWQKATTNLISNAIKYTKKGGYVVVTADFVHLRSQPMIQLSVRDTGIGISPKFISQLFEPFSREQISTVKGIGLGLALTKELVELMGGNITVKSEVGNGSVFTIQVPATEIDSKPQTLNKTSVQIIEGIPQPLILIAEDHQEVNTYIQFCLKSTYRLLSATNGSDAWELCQEHIPDLVISDVMMPKWDGLQLGKVMREHIATNHIPIVLLTAKTNHGDKLEGLNIGADAYLTKPFDRDELLIRVNHLIDNRNKLREKYQQGNFYASSNNKNIDAFIQSVMEVVRENMDNDEFNIPKLADKLHISRVHLFRKIKNLTGMSPTKLVRGIRLQHARNLLSKKELTIAEIAYQTGFKDPAYFTRVYIEEFGKTPSQSRN
ncbi:hybrid sensor histidine kinase/response regulator transcription factor [Aquimarina algiphila]|uniref:hybrid sensor histidine kinase/response regulator transcription factor n=1 Tax=Aquimarina algiphila TaxID=2047982 RepID=UPI00232FA57E|nr:hybrid sensor histidine kinase/response regulator transcription factor [Aquimarina algiphila]